MRISFLFLTTLLFNISLSAQSIERVEPPNWWIDMVHEELQLMIYGENIAELKPRIDHPGIQLTSVVEVPNENYLFMNLKMDNTLKAGTVNIDFYRKNQKVLSHPYRFEARESGSAGRQGFDNSDVLYLITPDRFVNGDPSNDNVAGMRETIDRANKGGRHGGDIAGISQSLDYIKDMGFTAIWLNPLLENDMEEYSYHGYSTTDYYKVDPRYGSNASYRELSRKAKSMGIDLIMDMIVNHCGSFHWWMDDLPAPDWINQWENYQQTNHRKTLTQDPYAAEADKKIFVDGWFVPTMPDLNQENELMGQYLIQNSIWWIEFADLSGIRMDTYPYPEADYMTTWTQRVMKEYPNFNVVGEEWYNDPAIVSYWQRGKNNPDGYTSELTSLMDFPLQVAVTKGLTSEESWGEGWMDIYQTLGKDFLYAAPDELVIFPDNHDMDRFYTQVHHDLELFKLGMIFYATTRGVPQIYYGTEILMENTEAPGDHGIIRTDFPGGWAQDSVNAMTGVGLNTEQIEAQRFIKKLLSWRKNATAIHFGKLTHYVPEDGVYVYFREDDQQKIMVILNKNSESTELKMDRFADELKGYTKAVEQIQNTLLPLQAPLFLKPMTGMIVELRR